MLTVAAVFLQVAEKSAQHLTDICFVVVLGWRKTKQLKLTCITAPTVRSHMGHLSVSQHSLCFLVMLLLDYVYFEVHLLFSLFFL